MTHTKGPWDIGGIFDPLNNWTDDKRAITADDGSKYHRRRTVARIVTPTGYGDDHPEIDGNAHMIAAAPELLMALKAAREVMKVVLDALGDCDHSVGVCNCDLKDAIEAADRAIAKAEGR